MSVALLVSLAFALRARADDAIDAWAAWAMTPKVWKGQVVLAPERGVRPAQGVPLDSLELPLRVHAPVTQVGRGALALAALERAYIAWRGFGWPLPVPDADLGGSPAFDLYLLPGAALASGAAVDEERAVSDFDAALTYATVAAERSGGALAACVQSAFAQATARALEPAEASSLVRATGEWAAYRETGLPGCAESFVAGQSAPEHSMLGGDLAAAGSGGMFLAMVSERHDRGGGEFVRALWELARQRSKGLVPDDQLRGSPDVWEVLAQVLATTEEHWPDEVEEFTAARWFAGEASRRAHAVYRVFAELPSDAAVPLLADLTTEQLPRRVRTAADGGIEALGSSYVRVRVTSEACANGCELRAWLRGELGPNWSLTALRLSADGREVGRTRAPARDVPEAYVPLALSPDTAQVVFVVTYLPRMTPDADPGVPAPRGVELTLELSR